MRPKELSAEVKPTIVQIAKNEAFEKIVKM